MPRPAIASFLLLVAVACGPSAPPEAFFGDWAVTSALAPGVAAVSSGGARAAVGTTASFAARSASYGDTRCDGPTYTRRWLAPATFTEAYGVDPGQLALTGSQIEFVDVTCTSGSLGQAGTLIVRADGTMLTVWDGVFYVLTKR